MRTYEVFCGNFGCASRRDGRLFKVADADTAGDRAALLRKNATSDDDLIDGIDGVLADGEVWVCPACRSAS